MPRKDAALQEDAAMANQVLFVHGAGGGAYDEDARLAANLAEKLGPSYNVRYPMMPNEVDPDYKVWKQRIYEELAAMGNGAILVGHSIGASVVIKLLTDRDLEQQLAGVFLIATPFWYDHEIWRWEDVELPADAATRLPSGMPLFLYHGREDEVVPFTYVEMYASALPQAIVRPLDGRNHQLNDELTEVANDIRQLGSLNSRL
jgi:hypothetical protein